MGGERTSDMLSTIEEFELVKTRARLPDERSHGKGRVHARKIRCKTTDERRREKHLEGFSHLKTRYTRISIRAI
jgi:hypothetical protein